MLITRGFSGRGRPGQEIAARIPPGQHLTTDFPVLTAGPPKRTSLERSGPHHSRGDKMAITLNVHIKAKPDKVEELKRELVSLLATTRAEKGCINYELHQSRTDPSRFMFYENWASRADLDAHIAAEHIQKYLSMSESLLAVPMDETRWTKLD